MAPLSVRIPQDPQGRIDDRVHWSATALRISPASAAVRAGRRGGVEPDSNVVDRSLAIDIERFNGTK